MGLRQLSRQIPLDPSFFSKVLLGKRSPPGEERVLRRLAELLEIDPLELMVSAGRIPESWQPLFLEKGFLRWAQSRKGEPLGLSAEQEVKLAAPHKTAGHVVKQGASLVAPLVRDSLRRRGGDLAEELL